MSWRRVKVEEGTKEEEDRGGGGGRRAGQSQR